MGIDLSLCQFGKLGLFIWHNGNLTNWFKVLNFENLNKQSSYLDFIRFEVSREDCRQTINSCLYCFIMVIVLFFLELLLEEGISLEQINYHHIQSERTNLCLFGANRTSLKCGIISSGISFIYTGSKFVIISNQDHRTSQWSHLSILSVNLN